MKKILFLLLISFGAQAQQLPPVKLKLGESITVTTDNVVPPDSTDCQCKDGEDGKDGLQGPKGDQGIQGPQGIQGIQGPAGICPVCPPSTGTGSVLRGVYFVENYGAVGNGSNDDTNAFQAAINAANQANGLVSWAPAPVYWNIKNTLNIIPLTGRNQVWMDIAGFGSLQQMNYTGPGGRPVFKIIGLKNSSIENVKIGIAAGITGVQIFDIVTTSAANSSTGVTFRNFYLSLGNGQDNIGVRTGFQSPGDISNYNFENVSIYGTGQFNTASVTSGQYGYQNLGSNTLSMAWQGGFVAGCDRAYSNITRDGLVRGNGACLFSGFGGSHNNEDFVFAWEQTYTIEGGRFEHGNRFIRVTANGAFSHVTAKNVTVHQYSGVNGNLIEIAGQCSMVVENSTLANVEGTKYSNPINISSGGSYGVLRVEGCSFTSDVVYTKTGNSQFDIHVEGNVKLRDKWQSSGLFANEL